MRTQRAAQASSAIKFPEVRDPPVASHAHRAHQASGAVDLAAFLSGRVAQVHGYL